MDRRVFLSAGVGAVVSGCMPAGRSIDAGNSSWPIIDTHQHLWNLDEIQVSWLKPGRGFLGKNFLIEDYQKEIQGLNLKAIYVEVDVVKEHLFKEANFIIDVIKKGDTATCAAVIGGNPMSPDFSSYVKRFSGETSVKGIRKLLFGGSNPGWFLNDTFVANMKLLADLGLTFDLCLSAKELPYALELVRKCPDTRFILDHCGNADPKAFGAFGKSEIAKAGHDADSWRKAMADLAAYKNVFCKISGFVKKAPKIWEEQHVAPIINHSIEVFGEDRVVFGSDWPICNVNGNLKKWLNGLEEVTSSRGQSFRKKLFYGNALEIYGLAEV